MYMAPLGNRADPSKLIILIISDPFWMCEALGNMLTRSVSNSYFGKRPAARDMTILRFHVGLHVPNIGYSEVYAGIWRYMGWSFKIQDFKISDTRKS